MLKLKFMKSTYKTHRCVKIFIILDKKYESKTNKNIQQRLSLVSVFSNHSPNCMEMESLKHAPTENPLKGFPLVQNKV